MKKIAKLFILMFVVLMFAGCSKVEYFFIVDGDGKVRQGMTATLDDAEINIAYNLSQGTESPSPSADELEKWVEARMIEWEIAFTSVLEGEDRETPDYEINITQNKKNGYTILKWEIVYASVKDYLKGVKIINGDSGEIVDDEEDPEIIKSFLTQKVIYKNNTFFKSWLQSDGQGSYISVLKEAFANFNIETDVEFVQTYATSDRKLRSNADNVNRSGGVTYHTWNMNSAHAENNKMELYYVYPNYSGWYIITIIATALFFGGYLVYILYNAPVKPKPKRESK